MNNPRTILEDIGWKCEDISASGVHNYSGDFISKGGYPVNANLTYIENDNYTEITKTSEMLNVKSVLFIGFIELKMDWMILMRYLGLEKK